MREREREGPGEGGEGEEEGATTPIDTPLGWEG